MSSLAAFFIRLNAQIFAVVCWSVASARPLMVTPVPCDRPNGAGALGRFAMADESSAWLLTAKPGVPGDATSLRSGKSKQVLPWPEELGWNRARRVLLLKRRNLAVEQALAVGVDDADGFEFHALRRDLGASLQPVISASLQSMVPDVWGRVEAPSAKRSSEQLRTSLAAIRASAVFGSAGLGPDVGVAHFQVGNQIHELLAGECGFFLWEGHRGEIAVTSLYLDDPASLAAHSSRYVDFSVQLGW